MNLSKLTAVLLLISGFQALETASGQNQPPEAQGIHNFSVNECISYAYEHQASVVNAALDVKSADYRIKQVIGSGLPQINGSASFQDYLKIPTTLIPGEFIGQPGSFIPVKFGVKYQSALAADVTQLIFDGSFLVGVKASKTYKELSQRNYTRSRIDVNVNVTKAYYQVLVSDEQVKLLDANLKQLKQQLDQTSAQNKQGFVEKIDVDRLTVQYNSLQTQRENVLRLLALNYQLLKFQMGMPVADNLILKDKLADVKLDESATAESTDTTFYKKRIEFGLSETQIKLYEYDVKRTKALFLPSLSAFGNYTSSYQNNTFGNLYSSQFPASYVGLRLNVPIFSGGQRTNQLRQAEITVQQSKNEQSNLKNALSLEANQAKIIYFNGLQTLGSQRKNQELAREVLRVSKIKYQQGVGSSIEVTQAQTALEDADNRYIQGLYDALVSKVDLEKAYGRIQ
ncbi:TolC family protein [Mucilaginibacter aquatilis]|uniref:TolC family protein n=1 Tax=Mucilaginibacter aquatilis TaxID=1517760 RepID=A0A6I4I9T3_9SPHI|nr:TolC family protein [Mucilaginibacter aquatilis]MVN91960.1 TolC family protein [Mucilaginibacter aquatilis]